MATQLRTDRARISRAAARDCVSFGLRKANRALSQLYDKALAPVGIRGTQFTLLNALALTGGATISRLADIMVMDRTTLTRNLSPLERDGLIAIVPGEDQRTRRVELEPAGKRVLERALPLWQRTHEGLEKALGARAAARLVAELERVIDVAGKA